MSEILNYNSEMEYRRFGKTDKMLSAITLGTMRFKHCWTEPKDDIPDETLEHTRNVVKMAFEAGINHIETANGYVKSEKVLGMALNKELKIPRNSYHLMTKSNAKTADEIRKVVDEQLKLLQTDYFDFYAWHGINNNEILTSSCAKNGPVEALLKMKEEGIIRHVGFSNHAPLDVLLKAIETNLFEFVNLHYYYFMQRNLEAVKLAAEKDMGVFIISPNDKGGMLYNAPDKVKKAVRPATPIQWNARFCLSHPEIHTLSFGMTEKSHFQEMKGIFPSNIPMGKTDMESKQQLDEMIHDDPYAWYDAYELGETNEAVNLPSVLRLRRLWKCYDMLDYAQYRYRLYEKMGHWLPGLPATKENIALTDLTKVPDDIPIEEMLNDIHQHLAEESEFKITSLAT